MVKGFKKNFNNNDDEDLSDLEMANEELVEENLINEKDALLNHQTRIKQDFAKLMKTKDIPWIETMEITADQAIDKNLNVDDDIKRELIFYNLTLKTPSKELLNSKKIEKSSTGQEISLPKWLRAMVKCKILKNKSYENNRESQNLRRKKIKFKKLNLPKL